MAKWVSAAAAARARYTGVSTTVAQSQINAKKNPSIPSSNASTPGSPTLNFVVNGKPVTMTQAQYDTVSPATKAALQASIASGKSTQSFTPVVNTNSNTITSTTPTKTTSVVPKPQQTTSLLPGLKFWLWTSEVDQTARNADIAKKFSAMAGDVTDKTEQEKKDAITSFLTKDLWLAVDPNNTNWQNTINKITAKINSTQWAPEVLPEKSQEELAAAERMKNESNEITENQFTDMTENLNKMREYIDIVADPAMQKTITDRIANINDAQWKIATAINLMDDSKQRIIRLQSNDAIEWITKQYMAKGLTEEEARAQSQADLNKQVMNERQTLLQAQGDTAALTKDMLTWVANSLDTIQQAKNANIQYDTNFESTLTQLKSDIINNKYASEKSAFDTYVGSTVMKSFNDMSAIEKAQLLKIADADTLDQNKLVAITTLLSSVGTLLTTRSWAIFKAIQWLKNGTMDYATALQTVVGNNGGGGTAPASTTPSTDYSYS